MEGYIINLYKYACCQTSHLDQFFGLLEKKGEENKKIAQDLEKQGKPSFVMQSLLSYGDFDRINIQNITDFSRYRDIGLHTKNWLGPRQSILVYTIPIDNKQGRKDLLGNIITQGHEALHLNSNDHRLIILTMVTLNPKFHIGREFTDKLKECKHWIFNTIDALKTYPNFLKSPDKLDYEIYGTFSPSELMIVWYAEQYIDVLKIVDHLKNITVNFVKEKNTLLPFSSFYSIIAQSDFPCDKNDYIKCKIFVYGEAELAFQKRDMADLNGTKEFNEYFKNLIKNLNDIINDRRKALEKIDSIDISDFKDAISIFCSGEYDYCIRLPADIICNPCSRCFHSGGIMHWKNREFASHIKQTRTNLYYNSNGLVPKLDERCWFYNTGISFNISSPEYAFTYEHFSEIQKKIYGSSTEKNEQDKCLDTDLTRKNFIDWYNKQGIRWLIRQKFPETVGMCDTLDLLYLDYVNNCSDLINDSWAFDLTEQFSIVLDYIAYLIYRSLFPCEGIDQSDLLDPSEMFSRISQISNDFKQVIYHVAQSKRTVFIVPSCHLRYLGQYDLILHAYYGLQKYLLNLAYNIDSTDKQPELIPMYTIDVVPEVKTTLYKIEPMYADNKEVNSKAIFSINLPLVAVVDFLRYSMIITHETFHLVVPKDRNRRNQVMGLLYFAEICARLTLTGLFEHYQKLPEEDAFIDERRFIEACFDYLLLRLVPVYCKTGAKFYKETYHDCIKSDQTHEIFPIWVDYQERLQRKIGTELIKHDRNAQGLIAAIDIINATNKEQLKQIIIDFLMEMHRIYQSRNGSTGISVEQRDNIIRLAAAYIDTPKLSGLHTELSINELTEKMEDLGKGFREASQDLPVIRIFGLSFVDYLLFRDRHKYDLLDLGKKNKSSDRWRIAMLCDYLLTEELRKERKTELAFTAKEILDRLKDKRSEYLDLFEHIPEMGAHTEKSTSKKKSLSERAFALIYENVVSYFQLFGPLRELISTQLAEADIIQSSTLKKLLTEDKFLADAYQKWKIALSETNSDTKNKLIFENNISMIHYFQAQGGIVNFQALEKRNRKMTQQEGEDC